MVWGQFQKQRSRGTQGFGLFDGRATVKAVAEKNIRRWFRRRRNETDLIMFHHRWPTSTVNVKQTAHPFNTGNHYGDTRYVLVHNGVIQNAYTTKSVHEDTGIGYQSVLKDGTFNDSETLLWDFARTMEGEQPKLTTYGSIAFICVKLVNGKPDKLYFARNNGRPLNLYREKEGIMLSSEGEGTAIDTSTLYTYNYAKNRLTTRYFSVPAYDEATYTSRWNSRSEWYPNTCSQDSDGEDDFRIDSDGFAYYPDEYDEFEYDSLDETTGEWETTKGRILKDTSQIRVTSIKDILKSRENETVESYVFNEIAKAQGHYETAYWELENQYYTLELATLRTTVIQNRMTFIQKCVDAIQMDINFVDQYSYHPMWAGATNHKIHSLLTEGSAV